MTVQPVETCRRVKIPIRLIRVRFHREVSVPLKAVTKKRAAERCGKEAALMNELRAIRTTMELLGSTKSLSLTEDARILAIVANALS